MMSSTLQIMDGWHASVLRSSRPMGGECPGCKGNAGDGEHCEDEQRLAVSESKPGVTEGNPGEAGSSREQHDRKETGQLPRDIVDGRRHTLVGFVEGTHGDHGGERRRWPCRRP